MKAYDIIDGETKLSVGCLLYYEKEHSFIIELQRHLDKWTAPLLFANTVEKGIFTIGRNLSHLWVNERVIPSGRQNIGSILANAGMSVYDELLLLEKSSGRCSQDSLYIQKLDTIPDYVRIRMQHNLVECVPCDNYSLLCFFEDETVRKVNLTDLNNSICFKKISSNQSVFNSVHLAAGGYCICFTDSIDIDALELYGKGTDIPLRLDDFLRFVSFNIIDSSECCSIMECSRQNLTNYTSKGRLVPIKKNVKGNLFTKGNVYRN